MDGGEGTSGTMSVRVKSHVGGKNEPVIVPGKVAGNGQVFSTHEMVYFYAQPPSMVTARHGNRGQNGSEVLTAVIGKVSCRKYR